jgi:hypothetical protein
MWRVVYRTFLGFLGGYVAYLPVTLAVEFALYGRIDSEREFHALYYAIGAPFLLDPSDWQYLQSDELILNIAGAVLIAMGIFIANNRRSRTQLARMFSTVFHAS